MSPAAALLIYAALAVLALAMPRHYRTVFQKALPPSPRRTLRITGWTLLASSITVTFQLHGAALGAVSWFAAVTSAGFAITLLLSYAPRLWASPIICLALLSCLGP